MRPGWLLLLQVVIPLVLASPCYKRDESARSRLEYRACLRRQQHGGGEGVDTPPTASPQHAVCGRKLSRAQCEEVLRLMREVTAGGSVRSSTAFSYLPEDEAKLLRKLTRMQKKSNMMGRRMNWVQDEIIDPLLDTTDVDGTDPQDNWSIANIQNSFRESTEEPMVDELESEFGDQDHGLSEYNEDDDDDAYGNEVLRTEMIRATRRTPLSESSDNTIPPSHEAGTDTMAENNHILRLMSDYYQWRKRNQGYGASSGRWGRSVDSQLSKRRRARDARGGGGGLLQETNDVTNRQINIMTRLLRTRMSDLERQIMQDLIALKKLKSWIREHRVLMKETEEENDIDGGAGENDYDGSAPSEDSRERWRRKLKNARRLKRRLQAKLRIKMGMRRSEGASASSESSSFPRNVVYGSSTYNKVLPFLEPEKRSGGGSSAGAGGTGVLSDYKQWRESNGYGNAVGRWG